MFHSLSELGRYLASLNTQATHYDAWLHRRALVLRILLNVLNVVVVISTVRVANLWIDPRTSAFLYGRELHL